MVAVSRPKKVAAAISPRIWELTLAAARKTLETPSVWAKGFLGISFSLSPWSDNSRGDTCQLDCCSYLTVVVCCRALSWSRLSGGLH